MKRIILLFSILIFSCEITTDTIPEEKNCGEVVRRWSQHTSEADGNPCGNNTGGRAFTLVVKNNQSGNDKNFCVNISEYINYELGSRYCDRDDPSGW